MSYRIIKEPNAEFAGYPWHEPASDPTCWYIALYPYGEPSTYPIHVQWTRVGDRMAGKVFMLFYEELYEIGEADVNEMDLPELCYAFIRHSTDWRGWADAPEGRWNLGDLLDDIEDELDVIINEHALTDWPTIDDHERLLPKGGALRPPLE